MTSVSRVSLGILIGGSLVAALGLLAFRHHLPAVTIAVAVIALLVIVTEFFTRRERGQLAVQQAQVWHGRPRLSPDEFASRYFEPSVAPTAARLRDLLQTCSERDLSQLQPSDDFLGLLAAESFNPLGRGSFFESVEEEFDIYPDASTVPPFPTFESFVHYVHQHSTRIA